jgi:hypothetical protein
VVQDREVAIKKTIRRQQLREMVPLADSTIYEMEQRGEFPRPSLSRPVAPSGIWRRSKPGWLRADQRQLSARSRRTSCNGDRALFESRVGLDQRHRRWDEHRHALLARDPGVDDVRPLLHHMAALHLVLRFVVNAA